MKKIFVVFIIVLVIGARVKYRLPIDVPTPVMEETWVVDENGVTNVAKDQNGQWFVPDDFLTEEEKEEEKIFRQRVIEAAGLNPESSDFEEELAKLYAATSSSDFPNYETYRLFLDYRYGSVESIPTSSLNPEPSAPNWEKRPITKKSACE